MLLQNAKHLWFLILSYTTVIILANWFDARLVSIAGLITDAGTIIFPLTFLLSDLITEVYGYKHARRAIWCGFLFNVIYILYGQLVSHLPSPSFANNNAMFDTLLAINGRIIGASMISYFCSEPVNSFIVATMKMKMHGKYMSLRFLVSTIFASGIDSVIFTILAFYGTMPNPDLFIMMATMWLIKVCVELLGIPLSTYLAKQLKNSEQLDVYDTHTKFNLCSLDTQYPASDNQFLLK